MRARATLARTSGSVKQKFETLKHIFNGLPHQPEYWLALQMFTSEGFLLENLQSNFPSHPNRI